MSGEKPEYYYKGGYTTYKEGVDPEVTCWHCGKTFLCDCTDATCRLCGAPWAKERCKEFNFVPKPKTPDSKVEVKACPIKVVYERFKHMDKLLCDPLIRKQYNGENDPYHLTLFDLWDAIKEHQSTPIANNGVSFDSIVDKLTHLNGDHLIGLELNDIHIIANFITRLPTTAPRGGQ